MMRFTESHEWIRVNGDIGVVGVSDHAQHELGEIVFVELPQLNKTIKAGQEAAVLESTKAAADVYSPVSGTIIEVNDTLSTSSNTVNDSPEKDGWIFKIKLNNPQELDGLMDEKTYKATLK
jgi:glycine cleavage system H protein